MRTLNQIAQKLAELREVDPEDVDESVFYEASRLLKQANEVALGLGIVITPVGDTCSPAYALAVVNRYRRSNSTLELLAPRDTAKLLGVSERTLYTLSSTGALPKVKLATTCVRYHRDDVLNFIEASKDNGIH
jgi:predicted DNA-binding transcriptional regulator AlpA